MELQRGASVAEWAEGDGKDIGLWWLEIATEIGQAQSRQAGAVTIERPDVEVVGVVQHAHLTHKSRRGHIVRSHLHEVGGHWCRHPVRLVKPAIEHDPAFGAVRREVASGGVGRLQYLRLLRSRRPCTKADQEQRGREEQRAMRGGATAENRVWHAQR